MSPRSARRSVMAARESGISPTTPGRGYSFVAPMVREQRQPATVPPPVAVVRGNLPALLTPILGRDDVIAALTTQLSQPRLLTVVGPGGVGKTTVAIAVAQSVSASYRDGVSFVGLSSLADPDLAASALTAVLGISQPSPNPISALPSNSRQASPDSPRHGRWPSRPSVLVCRLA